MKIRNILKKVLVSKEIEDHVNNIPKEVGAFGYDPWGFNLEASMIAFASLKPIYDKYFRVEPYGLENIPKEGRALLIPNHSGQLPLDGIMIGTALATNPNGPRAPRAMIERFFPTVPFVGNILNLFGGVIGDPANCQRMLENDEAVIVFPEGIRGSGKLYNKRYQLQRFGNGFMHLAMSTNSPIIPVGVVGCEETIPAIGNIKPLAKALGIPYVPVALPFVFPAKVILMFGEPVKFSGDIDSETQVTNNVNQVKKAIEDLIKKGQSKRKGWFK